MTPTDQQNVPKLRFPGFQGEWIRRRCDYFLRRETIQVSPEARKTYREIGIRSHGKGVFHKEPVLGQSLGDKRVFEVVPNTLALNIVFAWEQALAVLSDEEVGFIASHRFPMFSGHPDRGNVEFFKYFFLRPRGKWLLELASPGGAGRNKTLGQNNFAELKLVAPTLLEQSKIVDFLGTVDTKIVQLAEKKRLLEGYKKGCMQQLFSRKIRFKDDTGNDFPNWEEKRLGEVATKTSSSISANSLKTSPGEYPVFGAGGITGHVDYFSSDDYHIGVVKDGAGVGRLHFCPPKSSILGTLESVKASGANSTKFIFYWMSQINFAEYSTGSTIPHVYFKDYGKKQGRFPHPNEQRKIADFLSAIDTKIDLVSQAHDLAQAFKKSLLQQMFV